MHQQETMVQVSCYTLKPWVCVSCRLPVHLHEIMMKVRKAEKELANDLRREPTKQEVANKAGITEAKLHGLHKVTISWHCLTVAWMAEEQHVFQSSKVAESAHDHWHDEQQEQILGRLELLLLVCMACTSCICEHRMCMLLLNQMCKHCCIASASTCWQEQKQPKINPR